MLTYQVIYLEEDQEDIRHESLAKALEMFDPCVKLERETQGTLEEREPFKGS